ncbi:MAG: aromatic amino acid transport family protein [Patescibacteria group bacterium]|nr:aromatic amino acid transport family protein [Patescibacteria group bacterium]
MGKNGGQYAILLPMSLGEKSFRKGVYSMAGTVIGAGTFAVPAAMHSMGVAAGTAAFWLVALLILITHLLFVDVALSSANTEKKRFPGYVGLVLGNKFKFLATIAHSAQILGAGFIYLVLGGEFMAALVGNGVMGDVFVWQLIFWVLGSVAVSVGLKLVMKIEGWLTMMLIFLMLVSSGLYFGRIQPELFFVSSWQNISVVLGVFLFSLAGWNVIPEIGQFFKGDRGKTRQAVVIGSLSAAFLIWLFGVMAYAAIGTGLGESVGDLSKGLPSDLFWLIPVVGLLAVATSYITLLQDLVESFRRDAKFGKPLSYAITFGVPLSLLFLTSRQAVQSIGFVGSALTSINALLLSVTAIKLLAKRKDLSRVWRIGAPLLCAGSFGVIFIWSLF